VASLRAVRPRSPRLGELFEELRGLVPALTGEETLAAIGQVAELGALLSAHHLSQAVSPAVPSPAPVDGLLDAKAAAKRLGVSLPTIYRLAREGSLLAVRLGDSTVRFDPADVARFVEGRKR
jgi:excisionase family DNA binding protein